MTSRTYPKNGSEEHRVPAGTALLRPLTRAKAAPSSVRQLPIRAQLALFSVLLVLIAAGGSAFAGWQIVEGLIEQATSERLNGAAQTFGLLYQQRVSDTDIVTRQLSDRAQLAQQIQRQNIPQITALIESIQTLRPFYSIVVADRQGNVLTKLIPPGRSDLGTNILDVPGVQQAIELGLAYPVLIRREDCLMAVAVTVPVKNVPGSVVGLMHLRFPLDEEFVRQIRADTGVESSLYCGDQLIATTLPVVSGEIGSLADPTVVSHVLEDGSVWEENVQRSGATYRARYTPLLDGEGKPAGMYAVAIPVQTLRDARSAILRYFVPVMGCIAALALAIGYWGSVALTGPLRRLAQAADRIGGGDLESPVAAAGGDEVARLAERMEEMRRRLYETYTQLRQLNQLKDEYLFSVAHEVRTPLASLVASVEILATDYQEMAPEELRSTVSRIERAALRLHTLVENVLDAGSIRAGRFSISPGPTDLRQVVESTVTTIQPLLDEKGQRVVVEIPAALPAVHTDERRISQVFANLLSNAAKYGPRDDRVVVSASSSNGRVLVRVTDHGPGIPLPEQGELFERYFRAASSARSSPGTGLGLAISKAIIEAHGGSVGLESVPGKDTTVWFTLPVASQARRRAELAAAV
ncbi:MAG: cache domain-containing protein [Chloroflexi bacterium]|nr:cache domain-containing protein [Chloroflexota bacterium]